MPKFETNRNKIVSRLKKEGWESVGGGKHDKFHNPAKTGVVIIVPRHRTISVGVARGIARDAGWTDRV